MPYTPYGYEWHILVSISAIIDHAKNKREKSAIYSLRGTFFEMPASPSDRKSLIRGLSKGVFRPVQRYRARGFSILRFESSTGQVLAGRGFLFSSMIAGPKRIPDKFDNSIGF